jgi:DNA-binding transcriptional MocR family regulator
MDPLRPAPRIARLCMETVHQDHLTPGSRGPSDRSVATGSDVSPTRRREHLDEFDADHWTAASEREAPTRPIVRLSLEFWEEGDC